MFGRKTKMPKIFVTKYLVQPKSADHVSKKPDCLYYELAYKLYDVALMSTPAVTHNGEYYPGLHKYCDLKKHLEHLVQHGECAQHTKDFLLPNDISVRINPLIIDVMRGTESAERKEWPYRELRDKYVHEICVEVIVRTTKEKQQKGLEQLLNKVGVIVYKEK